MGRIEQYYNLHDDEWERLQRHPVEFAVTMKKLNRCVPPRSRILDVGGGPGRYSIELARQGHEVTLYDLSEGLVAQAARRAREAGVTLKACIRGDVLELSSVVAERDFDAVLCMGPLYHLLEQRQRTKAVGNCLALLQPGGIFAASFISVYAPIVDCLRHDPGTLNAEKFLAYFTDGRYTPGPDGGFTDAYFIHPDEILPLMAGFPLKKLSLSTVEGLSAPVETRLMELPSDVFGQWVDLLDALSDNPEVLGSSEHLLYIGRKEGGYR